MNREKILDLVARGWSDYDIEKLLSLSPGTVRAVKLGSK